MESSTKPVNPPEVERSRSESRSRNRSRDRSRSPAKQGINRPDSRQSRRTGWGEVESFRAGLQNIQFSSSDKVIDIQDDVAQGARYIIDGPLRRVPPYYFTYITFCKLRWRDRLLLEVFSSEFRDRTPDYYKWAIESGQVTVNNKIANLQTIVRNGDAISHRTHKHESPVTSRKIKIVYEDDEIVVIDKPSGIPAHPTGRYRFNTVVMVLKHEMNMLVHPCNRLDRLTSGLMFLAKSPKSAEKMGALIRDREVLKEYIARVKGEFPLGKVICEEPLSTVAPKLAFNRVDPAGKPAKTEFIRISYDGTTSIVRCHPFTGRTHQIRVHLQYLGHPIANDPTYSSISVWGPELGKGGAGNTQEIIEKLDKVGKTEAAESFINPRDLMNPGSGEVLTGEHCKECQVELFSDPSSNDLELWLHALNYQAADGSWSYKTELPDWALEPHLKYMQLALEEALKSTPLETAFCVGAVLVKDGQVLETGYSREWPGNTHAEQSALEKYFEKTGKRQVPEGTVIYTTMEPCSERLSGNLPCVDRILDTNIKTVFVGVVEPDTFVAKNTGYDKLSSAGIQYIHIPGFEKECLDAATRKPIS